MGKMKYNFDKDTFVKQYNELKSSREMAKLYGCDKGTILNFAKSIGYVNEWELPQDVRDYIIASYESKSSAELAKELNKSRGIITKVWYDAKLSGKLRNRYDLNHDYFENIDSPDKAYFLGFMAADGNVFARKSTACAPIIKLSLKSDDEYALELFAKCISSNKPLYHQNIKSKNAVTEYSTIEIVSEKMASDLSKYGIVPRKTYNYKMQDLSDEMMSHFIRGYFDGDGSIAIASGKAQSPSQYRITIVGFEDNMLAIQGFLESVDIKMVIVYDKRTYGNQDGQKFCNLIAPNVETKYKFLKYIYQDCGDLCLKRKKDRADIFFDAITNNYANRPNLYAKFLEDDTLDPQLDFTGTE
jgi:hypothetical protein